MCADEKKSKLFLLNLNIFVLGCDSLVWQRIKGLLVAKGHYLFYSIEFAFNQSCNISMSRVGRLPDARVQLCWLWLPTFEYKIEYEIPTYSEKDFLIFYFFLKRYDVKSNLFFDVIMSYKSMNIGCTHDTAWLIVTFRISRACKLERGTSDREARSA